MSTTSLLTFLALFSSFINTQIIAHSRVQASTENNWDDRNYTVTFENASSIIINKRILLSLTSFSSQRTLGLTLSSIDDHGFAVKATHRVFAFSYILVECNEEYDVGKITSIFPNPQLFSETQNLKANNTEVNCGEILSLLGTVEPFISKISIYSNFLSTSWIKVSWDRSSKTILINRTIDITLVEVHYLVYIPGGSKYPSIIEVPTESYYNLAHETEPIFIGHRDIKFDSGYPIRFVIIGSVNALVNNIECRPHMIEFNNAVCPGSAIKFVESSGQISMTCSQQCGIGYLNFRNQTYCINVPNEYLVNSTVLVHQSSTEEFGENYTCSEYRNLNNEGHLTCTTCNSVGGYINGRDGTCVCGTGYYYRTEEYEPHCYECRDGECPFVIETIAVLKTIAENSSEYMEVKLTINHGQSNITPHRSTYSNINLQFLINNTLPQSTVTWTSPTTIQITLNNFIYSQVYSLRISTTSQIWLNYNNTRYQTKIYSKEIIFQRPSVAQFLSDSMQTINNVVPTASLISALVGSKVNIFSFVQASSILFLSSYIKWSGFGSINRVSLTQALFKLTPTNFFNSLGVKMPVPDAISDDDRTGNFMLAQNGGEMYITFLHEFLISTVIQILLFEIIYSILKKVFVDNEDPPGYQCNEEGKVTWLKKSFVSDFIDSDKYTLKGSIGQTVGKMGQKRYIFYITMINSQLVFHSYMIFSQFKIQITTTMELLNLFFSITMLALILFIIFIGPYSPLILFKCIGVVYKKRDYTIQLLYSFYLLCLLELFVYGASIAMFSSSILQCLGVLIIIGAKIVCMRKYMKRIEFVRSCMTFAFFFILATGSYFPNSLQIIFEFVSIILMIIIGIIEILKIIRSVVIAFLSMMLKEPLSFKGMAIVQKVKDYRAEVKQKGVEGRKNA